MSYAKKCDRCGKYYEPYDNPQLIKRYDSNNWREPYDLCPECNYKFIKWMNKHQEVIKVDK